MSEPGRKKLRPWKIAFGVAATVVVALGAWLMLHDRPLARLTEELDAGDPGWRLGDILAARVEVTGADNSAAAVAEATGVMTRRRDVREIVNFADTQVGRALLAEHSALRRRILDENRAALAVARRIADMPAGRRDEAFRHGMSEDRPEVGFTERDVGNLLRGDALDAARTGAADAALRSVRAALHAAASRGDEPGDYAGWRRAEFREEAARTCARVLSLCEPSAAEMARLAEEFRVEEAEPIYRRAVRGERALVFARMRAVAGGRVSVREALSLPEAWESWEDANVGVIVRRRAAVETLPLL